MKLTNNLMISDIRILGDINVRWFMLKHFNIEDVEHIFNEAKAVYCKMITEFLDSDKSINFCIKNLYYPEYCFELFKGHYILVVITPFGKYAKLKIKEKVKDASTT